MLGTFKISKSIRNWVLGQDRDDPDQAAWPPTQSVDADATATLYGSEVKININQTVSYAELSGLSPGETFQYDLVYVQQPDYLPTYQYSFVFDGVTSGSYNPSHYDPDDPDMDVYYNVAEITNETVETPFEGPFAPESSFVSVYDQPVPWLDEYNSTQIDTDPERDILEYRRQQRVAIRPFPFRLDIADLNDYILLHGQYKLVNKSGQKILDVEVRDFAVTNLGVDPTSSDFSSGTIDINGDFTVYPNLNATGIAGWKPKSKIDYRLVLGHPALPRAEWIEITDNVPLSSVQEPDANGIVASFSEIVNLSPLVTAFSNLSRSLPDILVAEAHAIVDVEDGANTITPIAVSAIVNGNGLDRLCREGDCEPEGTVNTFGFLNIAGAAAGLIPDAEMSCTGCLFEASPGSLGYGWQLSAYKRVEEDADLNLTYHDGSGMIEQWIPDDDGNYIPAHGDNYIEAKKNPDGSFTLTHRDQSEMKFDTLNRIESWTDTNTTPNVTAYTYENGPTLPGRLIQISDGNGRETNLGYGGRMDGQPETITSHSPMVGSPPVSVAARVTTLEYFPSGHANENRLMKVTDPAGETTEYTYTSDGRLQTITDTRDEVAMEYEYYQAPHVDEGKVKAEIIYGELRREYVYDEAQKLVTLTKKDLTTVNPSPDREMKYFYDDYRNIVETHEKVDGTTWNITKKFYQDAHDPHLVTKLIAPNGAITEYSYTPRGNLSSSTDALGNRTVITYAEESQKGSDFPDLVTSIKRPDVKVEGVVTSYAETKFDYDQSTGNLSKVTDALGNESSFLYTDDGLLEFATDANGNTTQFFYGGSPKVLEKIEVPKGEANGGVRPIHFEYDGFDNVTKVRDALGNEIETVYDNVDRVSRVIDARNQETEFQYPNGLLAKIISPNPNVLGTWTRETEMIYDTSTRLKEVKRDRESAPQESRVAYQYDGFSQLLKLTRKQGTNDRSYNFAYDILGRMTSSEDPLNNSSTMAYEDFCETNSVTSARGIRRVSDYSLRCELTEIRAGTPGASDLELGTTRETRRFEYDELGRMLKSVQPVANYCDLPLYGLAEYGNDNYSAQTGPSCGTTREYVYDALDRLRKVTFEDDKTMEMDYDAVGNLIMMKDPEGKITRYKYYRDNLLHKVEVERGGLVVDEFIYTYDDAGRPETIEYPEVATNSRIKAEFKSGAGVNGWDEAGQLIHLRYLAPGGGLIREFEYAYDGAGNRISQIEKTPSTELHKKFTYDWLDRLVRVESGPTAGTMEEVAVYAYDESDNRLELQLTAADLKYTYTYDEASNIETRKEEDISGPTPVQNFIESFTPDDDGNVLTRSLDDGSPTVISVNYTWGDFNKLLAISSSDNSKAQESSYTVSGFRRSKKAKDGTVTGEYAAGLSTAVSKSTARDISYIQGSSILGFEEGGSRYYFLTDALGSVRDIVRGSDGAVLESYSFDERGNKTVVTSAGIDSPKTFVGSLSVQDEMADTGLYLMGHRWMDPSLGRFLSRDPIGFQGGLNLYSYAGNNPTTFADPTGLNPDCPDKSAPIDLVFESSEGSEILFFASPFFARLVTPFPGEKRVELILGIKVTAPPGKGVGITAGPDVNGWVVSTGGFTRGDKESAYDIITSTKEGGGVVDYKTSVSPQRFGLFNGQSQFVDARVLIRDAPERLELEGSFTLEGVNQDGKGYTTWHIKPAVYLRNPETGIYEVQPK